MTDQTNLGWRRFVWNNSVHYISLDHGHTYCRPPNKRAEARLRKISKQGLKACGSPAISELLTVRGNSVFLFPYYEGCLADEGAYHTVVDLPRLMADGFEVYSGNFDFINSFFILGSGLSNIILNTLHKGWEKEKGGYPTFEKFLALKFYNLNRITSAADLPKGAELVTETTSYENRYSFKPFSLEILVKGDIPKQYIRP